MTVYISGCINNLENMPTDIDITPFNGTFVLNSVDSNTPPSPADFIVNYMGYNLNYFSCLWRADLGNNYYIILYLSRSSFGVELTVALCVPIITHGIETYYVFEWILVSLVPKISCTDRYVMNNTGPHIVGPLTINYGFTYSRDLNLAATIIVNNDNTNYHKHLHVGVIANYPIYSVPCVHHFFTGTNVFSNNCNIFNDPAIIMTYDPLNNDWVYIWPDGIHYVNFYVNNNILTCNFGKLNTIYQVTYGLTLPNQLCQYPQPHQQDSYDNGATYLLDASITNHSDCSDIPIGIFIEPV
jgi:hypothetical protein